MKLTVAAFEEVINQHRKHITFQQYCALDRILQDLIRLEETQSGEPPPFLDLRCETAMVRRSEE